MPQSQERDKRSSDSTSTTQIDIDADLDIFPATNYRSLLGTANAGEWMAGMDRIMGNPLSFSASATSYDSLGCFPLGLEASSDDFRDIVKSQHRLKRLRTLEQIQPSIIKEI